MPDPSEVIFFPSPAEMRKWFRRHQASEKELWVGFYRKHSAKPSITWPESVDEALCVGWIDGIRKRIDQESYKIRFTPRRRASIWSAVNIRRAEVLTDEKRMQPAGLAAFAARRENKSGIYAHEQRPTELPHQYADELRRNRKAWDFFRAQPPSYRKTAIWWIISAKREETRRSRTARLTAASAQGERL